MFNSIKIKIPVNQNGNDEYSDCYTEVKSTPKKKSARIYVYTPRKCEDCKRPLTWHDRQEAPYADGRFLCAECRAEYMDLHHPDPFGNDAVPAAVMCV